MRHHDRVPAFASTNLLIIVTLIIALSVAPASTNAATLDVCKSGCTFSTIQAAINAAAPNDTISIAADTYFENLTINKSLTLSGAGKATTIIDGNQVGTVVTIPGTANVNISGVTIQHGQSPNGGGVNNIEGTVALINSAINHNTATGRAGGGIYNADGKLSLTGSDVISNTVVGFDIIESGGAGIYSSGGLVALTNSTISDNLGSVYGHGAGIEVVTATLTISGSTIDSNKTTLGDAGGIFAYTSTLTLSTSTISNNMGLEGGGIEVYHSGSSLTINNSTVSHNTATLNGGGIANAGGVLAVNGSTISDNVANGNGNGGGGIWNGGDTTLTGSTLSGNSAPQGIGGGIYATHGPGNKLIVDASTVRNNTSAGSGGGIYSAGGTVALTNNSLVSGNQTTALGAHGGGLYLDTVNLEMIGSTVSGNHSALGDGGGIWGGDNSTLTVNSSTISNNTAPSGAGGGIDAYINTNLTLNGSTISGNTAGAFGGGIYNDVSTVTLLNNSNVTSNTATGPGGGGGIYNDGATTLTDSAISGNVASQGDGGGIHNIASATLTVDHGTISGNRAGSAGVGVGGGIASHSVSVALLKNNSTVSGNTAAGSGGGIYNQATLQLDNTTVADNIVDNTSTNANGGGIANVAQATINASRILRNRAVASAGGGASNGAGIINQGGQLTLTNSTVNDNVLDARNGASIRAGGGIFSTDPPTNTTALQLLVRNSDISHNTGTGIYINSGSRVNLTDVTVSSNNSPNEGGGVFVGDGANIQITRAIIQSNMSASSGGGIFINTSAVATLTDASIISNTSRFSAGGLGVTDLANVTLLNSNILANIAESPQPTSGAPIVSVAGGGVDNRGVLTIVGGSIKSNQLKNPIGDGYWSNDDPTKPQAREWGGGIYSEAGSTLVISGTTISGHKVGGDPGFSSGGGLYLGGATAELTNVIVRGNEVYGNGGGIFAQNTALTINGSTISGNYATFRNLPNFASCQPNPTRCQYNEGGGIHLVSSGTLSLANSTISGNHSDNIAGGIFWQSGSLTTTTLIATLDHVTVTNNTAPQGGGVWRNDEGTDVRVRDSIIAANKSLNSRYTAEADCQGGLTSESGNLFGIDGECSPTASDLRGTATSPLDPQLDLFQPNGGPTPTHALLAGSPAFAATQRCPARDQRGILRPQTGGCAIGAYEPGRATKLVFTDQPTDSPFSGEPFATPFRVTARDDLGNIGSLDSDVTLGIAVDPNYDRAGANHPIPGISPAKLIGTTTKSLVRGEAIFSPIAIDQPGNGFMLSATAGGLSSGSATLNVRSRTPVPIPDPQNPDPYESNDNINVAVPIIFDATNTADYSATISSKDDVDVFRFIARPSSHITITLARPDEYDLVLLRDPKDVAADITDTLDLSNLIALQRSDTPRGMVPRGMVPRGMVPSDLVSDTQSLDSLVVDANADPGTDPISLELSLPLGGTYYIAALSTRHKYDVAKQYHLQVELQPGDLELPAIIAEAPGKLNIEPSQEVRNIFLTNFPRMTAVYTDSIEQQAAIGEIQTLLSPGSAVMTQGIVLDLPTVLQKEDREHLDALYNQWDAARKQPLLANEVANQIQRILTVVLRKFTPTYYPNATNLVLVGGDAVLPFTRVPDENRYGNEQAYFASLQLESSALLQDSAFAASLSNGFMQTDDFYARRRSVIYRGRQLALPDLGVGRLVELPTDIARYLRAYTGPDSLVVRADQPTGNQSNTLVTSYDFLDDGAQSLTKTLGALGVNNVDQLTDRSNPDLPVPDIPWTTSMLEDRWFSGQLPQLTSIYTPTASDPSTRYALVSLNGHFNHHSTQPATVTADIDLEAARLLTPTIAAGYEPFAFFKRWQSEQESASLLYSIGCHSGLSAPDNAFGASQAVLESADFASAVLKQGGNWIGNTGYGYADTEVVGYSEQLATFFTRELGRDVADEADTAYMPTTIGQAMMRAKQRYVREKGVGGFSVADEKVITGWTLYGLPFIQVRVPKPFKEPAPPPTIPPTVSSNGTFTRSIVVTADWTPYQRPGADKVELWEEGSVLATVTDSLAPGSTQHITGTPQGTLGAPVLPVLSIPLRIPLQDGRNPSDLPQLRGVSLREATGIDAEIISPKITSPITDTTTPKAPRDLSILGLWTPNLTYGAVRIAADPQGISPQLRDVLLVHPAQFRASDSRSGELRRFASMVIELTYVDPSVASPILLSDHQGPVMIDFRSGVVNNSLDASGTQEITFTVQISNDLALQSQAAYHAAAAPASATDVRVLYTIDGVRWSSASLDASSPDGNTYTASVRAALKGRGVFAYLEARDVAGNVTLRVVDQEIKRIALPVIRR